VRKTVKSRYVPLLALGSAYCFLVMMFNVPIPDGTTAHAVGAVLVAVLLGPWAAVIAVCIALAIQALFFGDGGVLALGANCFNMAFVMPMVGYAVYRVLAGRVALTAPRRAIAAGIGGYVGLNAAALCVAVELGVQPSLFHRADGTPLYAPFHLAQTIPALALAHLTVAGGVELALTAGVIAYLQRANLPLLRINHRGIPDTDCATEDAVAARSGRRARGIAIGLAVMVVLTPLGLLAPGHAFGEVPLGGAWHHAFLDGYGFAGDRHPVLGYLVSSVVGVLAVLLVVGAGCGIARVASTGRRRKRVEVGA
jgi:cobalt/nickel transport system permease protein